MQLETIKVKQKNTNFKYNHSKAMHLGTAGEKIFQKALRLNFGLFFDPSLDGYDREKDGSIIPFDVNHPNYKEEWLSEKVEVKTQVAYFSEDLWTFKMSQYKKIMNCDILAIIDIAPIALRRFDPKANKIYIMINPKKYESLAVKYTKKFGDKEENMFGFNRSLNIFTCIYELEQEEIKILQSQSNCNL